MTDHEAAVVLEAYRKKKGVSGDDVNMGDDAEAQTGVGSPTHPAESDADEPQDDFADAAKESERSGKQLLLDALGNLFAVSESVNVCIFCGSTKHDHADCDDPKKADINKVLKGIRTSLEDESSGPDVDMPTEGEEQKEGKDGAGKPTVEEEPAEARTGEYHWYDKVLYMSEVGDLDEAGKFCISGRKIAEKGPRSFRELNDVISDAIVRGGGDVWKVPDFMAAYTDMNMNKAMYRRVEAPADGFLKIVPINGCYFHNYELYGGIEIDFNYRFGRDNKLDPYESDVSTTLNRALRHHAGKVMNNPNLGLVCDDAGWIPIDDLLRYENVWKQDSSRSPRTFLAPRGIQST